MSKELPICDPSKYFGESPVGELCQSYKEGKCLYKYGCFCKKETKD